MYASLSDGMHVCEALRHMCTNSIVVTSVYACSSDHVILFRWLPQCSVALCVQASSDLQMLISSLVSFMQPPLHPH
jgi:hypothetical protein